MSDSSGEGAMTFRTWTNDETEAAILIWSSEEIQRKLRGKIRNRSVYQRLSEMLLAKGYKRNWIQCREKLKKLRLEYQKLRQCGTAHDKSNFRFYEQFDAVLGHPLPGPAYNFGAVDMVTTDVGLDMTMKSRMPVKLGVPEPGSESVETSNTSHDNSEEDSFTSIGSSSSSSTFQESLDKFVRYLNERDRLFYEQEDKWRRLEETNSKRAEQVDRMLLEKMDTMLEILAPSLVSDLGSMSPDYGEDNVGN